MDAQTVTAEGASDDLEILAAPKLRKTFLNDPVEAGSVVNLEFTISYSEFASGDATSISFTDDLNAVIPGLAAIGLPLNDICGTGSSISGTTNLSFTGGSLSPGDVCTFIIPVQVPVSISPGTYTNTTSTLSATVGGQAATSDAATDELNIGGLNFTKEFIGDPVIPGDLVTLRYTIDNTSTFDATSVTFTDNLTTMLTGTVTEAPLPVMPCGGSLISSGNFFLIFTGATVSAGSSCTFDIPVRISASANSGTYIGTSSNITATMNGSTVSLPPAVDDLIVDNELIQLTKSFTDDPVEPGSTVNLEYTITNLSSDFALSNVAFTDDLDAILSGLAATGLPQTNICGVGSQINGTSTISFTGGNLAAGASCTFSVTVQVPLSATRGSSITSTTSIPSGTANGLAVTGFSASDDLKIQALQFTKSITGPVLPGEITTITYTITNADPTNPITNMEFSDDLDAFIPGMTTTNLPLDDICGLGAQVSGNSIITLGRGQLVGGQSCNFDVMVQVPCNVAAGSYNFPPSTIIGLGGTGGVDATTAMTSLTVNSIGTSFTAPGDLCTDDGTQNGLSGGSPSGGVYSGPGVTDDGNGMTYSFDPAAAGEGIHIISYTEPTCSEVATDQVNVIAVPSAPMTTDDTIEEGDPVMTGLSATVADCITTPAQKGTTSLTINTADLVNTNFSFGASNTINFDMTTAGIPAGAIVKDAGMDGIAVSIAAVTGNAFVICSGSDGEDATLTVSGPDMTASEMGDGQNMAPGPWTIAAINSAAFDGEAANGPWTFTFTDTHDDPSDCGGSAPENEITGSLTLTVEWEVPAVTSPATITWWNAPTGGTQQGTGMAFDPTGNTAEEGPVDLNVVGDYTFYAQSNCSCADGRSAAVLTVMMALPLDLLSFNGRAVGKSNLLEWTTANELNTLHFQLERSADGTNFQALDNPIAAAGFSTQEKAYSFLDEKPINGVNFYRLQMVDQDGSFAYSPIVALSAADRWQSKMQVVPVPTRDWATLQLTSPGEQLAELRVLDMLGAIVQTMPLELRAGDNVVELDFSEFPAGVYWLQVGGEGWNDVVRLVVE